MPYNNCILLFHHDLVAVIVLFIESKSIPLILTSVLDKSIYQGILFCFRIVHKDLPKSHIIVGYIFPFRTDHNLNLLCINTISKGIYNFHCIEVYEKDSGIYNHDQMVENRVYLEG